MILLAVYVFEKHSDWSVKATHWSGDFLIFDLNIQNDSVTS